MTEKKLEKLEKTVDKQKSNSRISQILIGNKPLMKYVIATLMQIKQENSAVIKARGKFISKAVDTAEIVRKKINENEKSEIDHLIKIGTDEFTNDEGKKISVSTIEIKLAK